MIEVTLTPAELQHAAHIGAMRHIEALMEGRPSKYAAKRAKYPWGLHIEGACGELAAAKALDLHWTGPVNNFKEADIGDRIQVRTRSKHTHDLIVRWSDNDEHWFVLVTGTAPSFRVHGAILGRTAKCKKWLRDYGGHGPAFFVPKEVLRPIDARTRVEAA